MEDQMGFEMATSTRKELLLVKDSLFQIELFHLSGDAHDPSRFQRRRYIEKWCAEHDTLDVLAEAKVEAAPAWED